MSSMGMQLQPMQRQEQILSQQMIQSLQILQMSTMELESQIIAEVEENPLLEFEEKRESDDDEDFSGEFDQRDDQADWEGYDEQQQEEDWEYQKSSSEETVKPDIPYIVSLEEQLLRQLHELKLTADVLEIAHYLVRSLDDDGWLRPERRGGVAEESSSEQSWIAEVEEYISGRLSYAECTAPLRQALDALFSLEPPGLGARTLQECLLLQFRARPQTSPLAQKIVEEEFDLLERRQVPLLSKKLNASFVEIEEALEEISKLNPFPGRVLDRTAAISVKPEARIFWDGKELQIEMESRHLPRLRINRYYRSLLDKKGALSLEEKKYMQERLTRAQWFVQAINQREETVSRVLRAIGKRQREFFIEGPSKLKPMILKDIADEVGLHLSTVNRVTNGKYIETEYGIIEIKALFSAGVDQEDGSEQSAVSIQQKIRTLIDQEEQTAPLSDQAIVDLLSSEGLKVARRTVAKYREQLGIPAARIRKRFV